MQEYQRDFITNLKIQRKIKCISQAKLAELCDVATSTIGNIECGLAKPSFDLILKFAEIFKIHPALLFISESELIEFAQKNGTLADRKFLQNLENDLRSYLAKK